jgi:hypothetical protein
MSSVVAGTVLPPPKNRSRKKALVRSLRRFPKSLLSLLLNPGVVLLVGLGLQYSFNLPWSNALVKQLDALLKANGLSAGYADPLTKTLVGFVPTVLVAFLMALFFAAGNLRVYSRTLRHIVKASPLLQLFAAHQIRAVLEASQELTIREGLLNTIRTMRGPGAQMTTVQFADMCGIVAGFFPDTVVGVWNTEWFPLHTVYERAQPGGEFQRVATWRRYFEQLEKAYMTHEEENENMRFMIVKDFALEALSDPLWKHFLSEQRQLRVNRVYLVASKDYWDTMHDPRIPLLGDIALFRMSFPIFGSWLYKCWLIGMTGRPSHGLVPEIGNTILLDEKEKIRAVTEQLGKLKKLPNTWILTPSGTDTWTASRTGAAMPRRISTR